jgi:type I restriction enzyme, S subunit
MKAWQGSVGVTPVEGIVSPAYFVFRLTNIGSSFAHKLLRSRIYADFFARASDGVRIGQWDLDIDKMKRIPILIPPADEQEAIVRLIDMVDRKMNRVIRSKRRLIELLNEQKQAIIQKAVTRGLDPNVRLKPSGVDWLGDVPEHWEMVPLKYLCNRFQNGATPPSQERSYYDEGTIPWYGPASINNDMAVGKPVKFLNPKAFDDGKARKIYPPALMVIVIGATAGRTGLLRAEGACNQQITFFELRVDRIEPLFAASQVNLAERWIRAAASTATIPLVDGGLLARLPIALPPVEEQRMILEHIDPTSACLRIALEKIRHEVDCLREYRTRLIADIVTGKLDVTGIELPETDMEVDFNEDPEEDALEIDGDGDIDAVEGLDE